LATKIITAVKDMDIKDDEPSDKPTTEANELLNLLAFLWAFKQGYTTSVPINDPPQIDNCDTFCQESVDRLLPPRDASHSTKNQSPAK
jgi:hypothetical protein